MVTQSNKLFQSFSSLYRLNFSGFKLWQGKVTCSLKKQTKKKQKQKKPRKVSAISVKYRESPIYTCILLACIQCPELPLQSTIFLQSPQNSNFNLSAATSVKRQSICQLVHASACVFVTASLLRVSVVTKLFSYVSTKMYANRNQRGQFTKA